MKSIVYLLCSILLFSCSNLEGKLGEMIGSEFVFKQNQMYQWRPDSSVTFPAYNNAAYKLVIYADSTECSRCYLSHLEHWDKYISLERSSKGEFVCLFVIEARKRDIPIVASMAKIKHSLFLDENFSIRHSNPQIPQENMFHTFLVDKRNKIIFVGNPLNNAKIETKLDSLLKMNLSRK